MPHPIERLRWVARAEGAGATVLAEEAAMALAVLGDDLPGLVTGCRRLIDPPRSRDAVVGGREDAGVGQLGE